MIGRFLEISVHAPDVLASINFYESLGFSQASTGEAWSYPYAVVTDGRLSIGLHQRELQQSPLLSFVLPDLYAHLDALEGIGIEILDRRLGSDVFNEATFATPGGQLVRLLEARTFSPSDRGPGETSRLGWFEEFWIARNPERKGLVPINDFAKYSFTNCVIPGYPELVPFVPDFWVRLSRVHSHLVQSVMFRKPQPCSEP